MMQVESDSAHPGFKGPFLSQDLTRPVSAETIVGEFMSPQLKLEPEKKLTGGLVNYYLIRVEHPQREDQPAYTAECEDIGEALKLTPNEMNIFKEIWRSANARQGNGKPDHKRLYGAEKIVHYAKRILRFTQLNP